MNEKSPGLRPEQAAVVWEAAFKRDALEIRLGEMMAGAELDDETASGLQGNIDKLSAFVDNYSHMEGGPFESPLIDPEKKKVERARAIKGASDNTMAKVDTLMAHLLENDGMVLEGEKQKSPVKVIRKEAGIDAREWGCIHVLNKSLQFLFFAQDADNANRLRSISLNTRLAEDLVDSGRLSKATVKAFLKYKKRFEVGSAAKGQGSGREAEDPEQTEGEEPLTLAERAVEITAEKRERELAERAGMTPAQRAADTRNRVLGGVRQSIEREVRAQNKGPAKERARLEMERGQKVEIKIEIDGERYSVVTSGRMFSETDIEVRAIAAVSLLGTAKYRHVYRTEDRKWPFILSKVNLAQDLGERIDRSELQRLVQEAIERGELSVNGSSIPSLTTEGLKRVRDAGIRRHTPGVMLPD